MKHTIVPVASILVIVGLLASGLFAYTPGFAYAQKMQYGPQERGTNGKCYDKCNGYKGHNTKQSISQDTSSEQRPICITVGGNSPISDSCNNTVTHSLTNSGGNGAVLAGNGYKCNDECNGFAGDSTQQGISQNSFSEQRPICITVGGNSPISDSCNNTVTHSLTNSGGNGLVLPIP
jgi:hypothetical protein